MSEKYDRQIELLNFLANGEKTVYQHLSNMFSVSVKTIKKDINELSLYFPIETYVGKNGGVKMRTNFAINGYIMKRKYLDLICRGLLLLQQIDDDNDIALLLKYFTLQK